MVHSLVPFLLYALSIVTGGAEVTKAIALFNQAGGVGKSTTTQNLRYHLGVRRHRVLLVDIGPQAFVTTFMGLDLADIDKTIYDALVSEEDELVPIYRDLHGMDLAPSNILLANAELELIFAERISNQRSTCSPLG